MRTHYVAHLKIERVDKHEPEQKPSGARYPSDAPIVLDPKREISEVTSIVIKGEDLSALLGKLGKHIELVEDE